MTGSILITALACALPDDGAPAEIVFLPEGAHRLTPKSHPKGIAVHLPADQGEAVAAAFNRDLAKRGNVKAWLDFEHTRKFPASGYPTAFRYEKGVGVMAAVEWSASGRSAVEGRDVRYFSPEFYIDKNGIPNGLPDRGPLGGLVTEPAFRDIPAIAAADAEADSPTTMSHLILASCGLLTAAESALPDAEALAASRVATLKAAAALVAGLEAKVTAAEAAAATTAAKRADDLVAAAITDGRIAPQDEKAAGFFRRLITAGDADAEDALAGLPKRNSDLTRPIVTAGQSAQVQGDARIVAAQDSARRELGADAPFAHVWARAAELDPAAFE